MRKEEIEKILSKGIAWGIMRRICHSDGIYTYHLSRLRAVFPGMNVDDLSDIFCTCAVRHGFMPHRGEEEIFLELLKPARIKEIRV